ncbi:substrate-binding periplasmic protein [Pseudoalteromonas phenolica]|uniref:substrate-binding periplasmic protein n=1 Tax=Pseudoalteromonas phenolica TaxID=161398 RepID=UPI001F10546B|nr:transporter substrate-binding domain-containing protein [Pseudoalteromonas phenolica]
MTKYTAITVFFLLFARVAWADHTIHVAIDHAPPFSEIDSQGESQGLIIDIVSELLKDAHPDYKIKPVPCPFSRCVRMLAQGQVDVMGGLIKTNRREQTMAFVQPPYMVLSSSFVFYANKNSDIEVNNFDELHGKRIAVMRGGAYYKEFDEDKTLNRVQVNSEHVAFDLLLKGRVDLVLSVEETAEVAMRTLNQPFEQLKKVNYRHTNNIYGHMAFSQRFAKTPLAIKLQRKMIKLAKSGQLNKLVAPYQLPAIPSALIKE